MHVKFFGVQTNSLIERSALAVIQVHGHIHLQKGHVTQLSGETDFGESIYITKEEL
jgi:hypothetical protein